MKTLCAYSALGPPTSCDRCGGFVHEDTQFTTDMLSFAMPQRRYRCHAGHSVYTGLVEPVLRPALAPRIPARCVTKMCEWCGDEFVGIVRQKYCCETCVRAKDAERTRLREIPKRQRLTAEALARARAIQFPRPRTHPVAYVERAKAFRGAWY